MSYFYQVIGAILCTILAIFPAYANNLIYEPAPYHGTTGNAVKSKAPTNPQQALNASIKIKATSDRRIAVDKSSGEFVIFDKTINNIYHGHVRTWSELTQEMKNVLINNGLVDRKGKIK